MQRLRFEVARRLNRLRAGDRGGERWTQAVIGPVHRVSYPGRDIDLRAGTSDFETFVEVFDLKTYDLSRFPQWPAIQARYERLEHPLIIDAGANVGMASLWFAQQFPRATILALEPEAGNFAELVRHAPANVRPMLAAIAPEDGFAAVTDPGEGEWGFRTERADTGIPAYSVATLMKEGDPFILKVDIEGGEKGLFRPTDVASFAAVFMEPHDWMLPGEGTSASFLAAIAALDRDLLISGANLVSVKA